MQSCRGNIRRFRQISLLQVQHGSRAADLVGCDHSSVLGARLEPFKNYLAFALKSSQFRGVGILQSANALIRTQKRDDLFQLRLQPDLHKAPDGLERSVPG